VEDLRFPGCEPSRAAALRWLPADGRQGWALVKQLCGEDFLRQVHAPLATVLSWGPDPDRRQDSAAVAALALSEALMLPSDPTWASPLREARLLVPVFAPVRDWYAPDSYPATLPPDADEAGVAPLAVSVSRLRLAALPPTTAASEAAVMAALAARGQPVPAAAWTHVGVAGLVALEAAAAGRQDLLLPVLDAAVSGPSASDRIAALFAALRLAPVSRWPPAHPAVALAARVDGL